MLTAPAAGVTDDVEVSMGPREIKDGPRAKSSVLLPVGPWNGVTSHNIARAG